MNFQTMRENPRVGAIVEVRMTSSRLPSKHLLESNGLPMISRLIRRIKSIEPIDLVILATTVNSSDDVFVKIANDEGAFVFRGSEDDVMGRVLQSAIYYSVDVICEITGDCPLVDVNLTQEAVQAFFDSDVDYLNNGVTGLPDGLGCQVFATKSLEISYGLTSRALDFEHVTAHIIRNSNLFTSSYIEVPNQLKWPSLSLSLDERMDYYLLNEVINALEVENFYFDTEMVIEFLKGRPDLIDINKNIYRRGYE